MSVCVQPTECVCLRETDQKFCGERVFVSVFSSRHVYSRVCVCLCMFVSGCAFVCLFVWACVQIAGVRMSCGRR